MKLNATQISIATGARIDRAEQRTDSLNDAMALYEIDRTAQRQAMFLANIGHETGGLKYRYEIWGPTPQQMRYERNFGRPWPKNAEEAKLPNFQSNRLAWRLGNHAAGDGLRFAGHGDWQITGRTNHALARDRLRARFPHLQVPDFEQSPLLLAEPQWAALAAGDYAQRNNLNAVADTGHFDHYCDLINLGRITENEGDSNGYEHRLSLYEKSLPILTTLHSTERPSP